jgi:CO/xanthine dehydrogenase Mo-binding subunit
MAEEFAKDKPWLWRPPKGSDGYIGRRGLRPKEAPEKVTGRAIYTNDIYLPGMLYAKVYRSPYAHARIKSMDSSKAEALPGVWAVIRYDDADIDLHDYFPKEMAWWWWRDSILPDTADFYGVRLGALVIAESEEICDQALKLIGECIEWEELPFILNPEEAIKPDAPLLHPELNSESNIWKDVVVLNQGDVENGFASSDNVIEFYQRKVEDDIWATPEPGCMIAHWKGEELGKWGELEFWFHGAAVGRDVRFGIMPELDREVKIKVHTPHNGAMFGGNQMGFTSQLCRYAVIATKKTQRPVKVVDDYGLSWEGTSFETGMAHYKVGFNNDGTIVAIKIDILQQEGHPITSKFVDVLKTPNVYVRQIHSYWSKAHEACWKDGAANCTLANQVINKVAAHLDVDPIKVQLLNDGVKGHDMAWLDENVKKKCGMPVRDSLKEVMEAGKAAFDWDNKWHPPGTKKLPNGKMHGVGFYAAACWATGTRGGTGNHPHPGISVARDGTSTIFFRRCDCGQSAPTTYCQIVADEVGLRYEDVKIEFKEYFYFDAFHPAGSMGSSINSYGLILTARALKKLILEYALKPLPVLGGFPGYQPPPKPSHFEGKTIEELDIKDSVIYEKTNPENTLPISTVTSAHMSGWIEGGPFFAAITPPEPFNVGEQYSMARQCCFIEVEVDTETGQVDVTKLVHSYDVGQSINPDVNEQQLCGGAYEGVGVSATEAIYYDPQTGVKLNDNFLGYPILTVLDLGPIEYPIVETHLGYSAYGLYGCSEAGKAATAAALLVPAVYNAIGKWIEYTPITPERILEVLGKAQ